MSNFINTLNQYQQAALETAIYPDAMRIIYPALGLNGEAGEVADKVKKIIRDRGGDFTDEDALRGILAELGDCLWYVAVMASDCGFSLQEVAEHNIKKLASRQRRGKINGEGDYR